MELPHPVPLPLAELIAQSFRVLAEPMRIRLLDTLRGGEAFVRELAETLGTSEQNVSKHLGLMLQAGIVSREKRGNLACYTISDPEVLALCELACGTLARRHAEVAQLFESGL